MIRYRSCLISVFNSFNHLFLNLDFKYNILIYLLNLILFRKKLWLKSININTNNIFKVHKIISINNKKFIFYFYKFLRFFYFFIFKIKISSYLFWNNINLIKYKFTFLKNLLNNKLNYFIFNNNNVTYICIYILKLNKLNLNIKFLNQNLFFLIKLFSLKKFIYNSIWFCLSNTKIILYINLSKFNFHFIKKNNFLFIFENLQFLLFNFIFNIYLIFIYKNLLN